MREIPLEALPNQSFSIRLDDDLYSFELKTIQDVMTVTIYRGQTLIQQGLRAVAGAPLIPFKYLQSGNFLFITENEALPYWTEFGVTQQLLYFSAEEIAAL
jgi:hypothetical protein